MMTLALSGLTVVSSWAGSASSSVQPSSKASRACASNRPEALERAPRPRTALGIWDVNPVDTRAAYRLQENITRTLDVSWESTVCRGHAFGDHRRASGDGAAARLAGPT